MRKTLAATIAALALVFGVAPVAGAVTAPTLDCAAGESVSGDGCYPTPDCAPEVNRLAYALADARTRIAAQAQRLERKQARIERLRARLGAQR